MESIRRIGGGDSATKLFGESKLHIAGLKHEQHSVSETMNLSGRCSR